MEPTETQEIELDLLLDAIFRRYGYDFRHYARAHLKRRIMRSLMRCRADHISQLIPRMLHDEGIFETFLRDMSIRVTEMFRDPSFFKAVRRYVVPALKTYPFIKVWNAGCATGEEAYSTAIILDEEGFGKRVRIYATDLDTICLEQAREGIYPLERLREYTANYRRAGGTASLSDYYCTEKDSGKMKDRLRERITFADHNLATGAAFGEINLIVCRNVLIYFDRCLQKRVLSLFHDSLYPRGLLALGSKESVEYSDLPGAFERVVREEKIYRRSS